MLNSFAELALVDALGWSLLHSLWQGLAVGAIAAVLLAALPASRPRARYAVTYAGLVLMLLLPAGTCVWLATARRLGPMPPPRPRAAPRIAKPTIRQPTSAPLPIVPPRARPPIPPSRIPNLQSAIRNLKSEI